MFRLMRMQGCSPRNTTGRLSRRRMPWLPRSWRGRTCGARGRSRGSQSPGSLRGPCRNILEHMLSRRIGTIGLGWLLLFRNLINDAPEGSWDEGGLLESPPLESVPLNKAGAPTYPYDILQSAMIFTCAVFEVSKNKSKQTRVGGVHFTAQRNWRYLYALLSRSHRHPECRGKVVIPKSHLTHGPSLSQAFIYQHSAISTRLACPTTLNRRRS